MALAQLRQGALALHGRFHHAFVDRRVVGKLRQARDAGGGLDFVLDDLARLLRELLELPQGGDLREVAR